MLIDITLRLTQEMLGLAWENTAKSLVGHLGTHFDVMDKEFPLEYTCRKAVVFDVSGVRNRDIEPADIDPEQVGEGMFVAFYTGFIEDESYGTPRYFNEHPQLSNGLIDVLLDKRVSIIGVDCAGIRRTPEHVPTDQRCAERGVFVVENLCDLNKLLKLDGALTVRTNPMRISGITGLPCRVVAEIG